MARTTALFGCALLVPLVAAHAGGRRLIPTQFEAGHVYAVPETAAGQRLRLLVDTGGAGGGGRYVINAAAAQRLGLQVTSCGSGDERVDVVKAIGWRDGKSLPPSAHPLCDAAALVSKGYGLDEGIDGVLGAGYLPGHILTFDYPAKTLWLEPASWRPGRAVHRAALGFLLDSRGEAATGFPRIAIAVDGEPIDLLLDTGATAKPTAAGESASGAVLVRGIGTTSYITTTVLERWHRRHPDWRVVADGDGLLGRKFAARLIRVPDITVAGWTLGPVWFTERPDGAFRDFMSQWMDRPVDGSLGANVFEHFAMTLDYPRRTAWIACAQACRAAGSPHPPVHSPKEASR